MSILKVSMVFTLNEKYKKYDDDNMNSLFKGIF